MSMTSKFSNDVTLKPEFATLVKEVHSCIIKYEFDSVRSNYRAVDKRMESVHLQLPPLQMF